jgi:orotate phosphoribosyltransferase
MVAHASAIKDDLARLSVEAESVRLPASTHLDDDAITSALRALKALRESGTELQSKLTMISRRSKIHSVMTLRDDTVQELNSFFELIGTIEAPWKAALDRRKAQRQTDIVMGAKEYDSGILSRAFGQSNS